MSKVDVPFAIGFVCGGMVGAQWGGNGGNPLVVGAILSAMFIIAVQCTKLIQKLRKKK